MSRSMMKCGNCGTPTYRKKASFCEICGHNEIVPDEDAITKPKTKTDKPTRKELEIQLKSLQTEKERLEKIVTETIEKLNKKSVELDQLQRSTDPQALKNAHKEILELEYSQYLLGKELECQQVDFEEQTLEVFNIYQKLIQTQLDNEEEKGGEPSMMKPEKKPRRSRKVKHPIATFIAIVTMFILAIVLTIAIFFTGSKQIIPGTTILTPTAQPTVPSLIRPTPTPTPEPTVRPTIKPTIKPTSKPTVSPQPTIKPINPNKTPESTSKKRRILTGKGKSLPFKIGDTVVGWEITIDGTSVNGGVILYNSPVEGILTDGVINPESWDIHNQRVITLDDIFLN